MGQNNSRVGNVIRTGTDLREGGGLRRSNRQMTPLCKGGLVLLENVVENDIELRAQRLMKCVARLGKSVIHDGKRNGCLPWRHRFRLARITQIETSFSDSPKPTQCFMVALSVVRLFLTRSIRLGDQRKARVE